MQQSSGQQNTNMREPKRRTKDSDSGDLRSQKQLQPIVAPATRSADSRSRNSKPRYFNSKLDTNKEKITVVRVIQVGCLLVCMSGVRLEESSATLLCDLMGEY